jgi:hypothetical protein
MIALTDQLIRVTDAYCAASGVTRSTVSNRIFMDGKRLDSIAGGTDLNTRSFEKAMRWFSANWPDGVVWPEGIARPEPSVAEASEEGAAA